jgi:peptidylprolyl isomerase
VHVPENASGKKAISTGLPRSDERVTFSPEVEGSVKSGADWPTAGTARDSIEVMNVSIDKGLMKPIRAFLAGSVVIGTLMVGACSQPPASTASSAPPPGADPEDVAHVAFDPSLGVHLDSMVHRASGLYVQDLVTGSGAVATLGRSIVVRYTGWLPNGKRFDGSEITVTLGTNKTIRGWEEGLLGMRVGGKRRLIIPPHLGYGSKAAGADIPPNTVLVFEMEAVSVF